MKWLPYLLIAAVIVAVALFFEFTKKGKASVTLGGITVTGGSAGGSGGELAQGESSLEGYFF